MPSKYVTEGMDEQVCEWMLARLPHVDIGDLPYSAMGQMDETGVLCGGVLFTNFTGRDVYLHVVGAGNGWVTRRGLGEVFRYIFLTLGCRRCTGMVPASNVRAQEFDVKLGFRYEGVLRALLPDDEDCFVYGMLREECRWLNVGRKNHGTAKTRSTCAPLRRAAR